jgi:hypothetical protein
MLSRKENALVFVVNHGQQKIFVVGDEELKLTLKVSVQ